MAGFERFSKLSTSAKAGAVAAVGLIVGIAYYFVFWSSLAVEKESLLAQKAILEQEKATYESRVQDYLAFQNEVAKLRAEQKELMRKLPRGAEIPAFLEQIHQQAEVVGVDVLQFSRMPEAPKDFFSQIPVKMRVRGSYHRIAKFFRNVGQLRRIVNIEGLALQRSGETTGKDVTLDASFVASTFRFLDKGGK